MRLAIGPEGAWVVLREIESDQCRIREVNSGESRWVRRTEVSIVDGVSLRRIGEAAPDEPRELESVIRTARGWGLVLVVGAASPVSVRALLERTSECESDLNGLLTELEVGEMLERTEIAGERAYKLTETAKNAVEALWSSSS